mmetsp:Transcript_26813/g.76938  ORF Transcript_26813/g.76938 Transcript_26813/m.76938 type:complete len:362 (+) Transcript_26813:1260-2345(+)
MVANDHVLVGEDVLVWHADRIEARGLRPLQTLVLAADVEPDSVLVTWLASFLFVERHLGHVLCSRCVCVAFGHVRALVDFSGVYLWKLLAVGSGPPSALRQRLRLHRVDEVNSLGDACDAPTEVMADAALGPNDLRVLVGAHLAWVQDLVLIAVHPNLEALPVVVTHGECVAIDALALILHEQGRLPARHRADNEVAERRLLALLDVGGRPPRDGRAGALLAVVTIVDAPDDLVDVGARGAEGRDPHQLRLAPRLDDLCKEVHSGKLILLGKQRSSVGQLVQVQDGPVEGAFQQGTGPGNGHESVHGAEVAVGRLRGPDRHGVRCPLAAPQRLADRAQLDEVCQGVAAGVGLHRVHDVEGQ